MWLLLHFLSMRKHFPKLINFRTPETVWSLLWGHCYAPSVRTAECRWEFRGSNRIDLCQHCCCSHSANCGWVNLNWSVRWLVGNSHSCVCPTWTNIWPSAEDNLELCSCRSSTKQKPKSFGLSLAFKQLRSSKGKQLKTNFKWFIPWFAHSNF